MEKIRNIIIHNFGLQKSRIKNKKKPSLDLKKSSGKVKNKLVLALENSKKKYSRNAKQI